MEQLELFPKTAIPSVSAELRVEVYLPTLDQVVLTLDEAKCLHEELDKYRHLWGNYNGR